MGSKLGSECRPWENTYFRANDDDGDPSLADVHVSCKEVIDGAMTLTNG